MIVTTLESAMVPVMRVAATRPASSQRKNGRSTLSDRCAAARVSGAASTAGLAAAKTVSRVADNPPALVKGLLIIPPLADYQRTGDSPVPSRNISGVYDLNSLCPASPAIPPL